MLRTLIVLMLLAVCLMSFADARMPQKNDYVQIHTQQGTASETYIGNITDIGNGLICLNATGYSLSVPGAGTETNLTYGPVDICIGTGQIGALSWFKKSPKV